MNLKSILLFFVFLLFLATKNELQAQNSTTAIQIDGNDNDWKANVFNVDSTNGFEYSISKNQDTLFLIVRFINRLTQIKSLAMGIQIGLDMYQKNKPQQFINFPLDNSSKINMNESIKDLITMQYSLFLLATEYELKKFMSGNGTYALNTANPNGIKLAFALNPQDQLVYEYAIPFSSLKNKKDPPGLTSTSIEINITIPEIKLNIPSTFSTEPSSYNSSFNSSSAAKLNKITNARPPAPRNDIKDNYKELFETSKKKIRVEL